MRCSLRAVRLAPPIAAKQVAVPAQEGIWLYNEQGLLPEASTPGQQDQANAIRERQSWTFDLPSEDRELVAQEGVFSDQVGARAGQV